MPRRGYFPQCSRQVRGSPGEPIAHRYQEEDHALPEKKKAGLCQETKASGSFPALTRLAFPPQGVVCGTQRQSLPAAQRERRLLSGFGRAAFCKVSQNLGKFQRVKRSFFHDVVNYPFWNRTLTASLTALPSTRPRYSAMIACMALPMAFIPSPSSGFTVFSTTSSSSSSVRG